MTDSWYERHLLPHLLDCACGVTLFSRQRQMLIPLAHGRVLEVGLSTGRNLPFYDRQRVWQVVGVDPALSLHPIVRRRWRPAGWMWS